MFISNIKNITWLKTINPKNIKQRTKDLAQGFKKSKKIDIPTRKSKKVIV